MFFEINPQLICNLEKFGLNQYEAKAYIGLVSLREATAHEIYEFTNLPRSKIYEILKILDKRGFLEVRQGTPTYFKAVDPRQVIMKIKDDFLTCANETFDQLNEISRQFPKVTPVWYIQSEWGIRYRIREIFDETKKELIIFTSYPHYLQEFESELKKLEKTCTLILAVEDIDRFKSFPFEFKEVSKEFIDSLNNIMIDGTHYTEELFIIADGKELIGVHSIGNKREAIVGRQSLIIQILRQYMLSL
jgi:HTH-type transcriptional regulator, sugar sensing transcriptional regulator